MNEVVLSDLTGFAYKMIAITALPKAVLRPLDLPLDLLLISAKH